MKKVILIVVAVLVIGGLIWWLVGRDRGPAQDEAMAAGYTVERFRQAADEADYFRAMDGGERFTPAEIRGRNTWLIWTGGNEAFWDWLANNSMGTFDLLKTVSSYPCSPDQEARAAAYEKELAAGSYGAYQGYGGGAAGYGEGEAGEGAGGRYAYDGYRGDEWAPSVCADTMFPESAGTANFRYYERDTRFCYLGLINEPGFDEPAEPDEYGLCLDRRTAADEPFDEEIYGRPTGVLGLRLYPNPNFDAKAEKRWREAMERDAFYTDPSFYTDRELVRPYRVGMSCAFCHVAPHPSHPPADPENPGFENLSGTIAAQYFWFGRIFSPNVTPDNFVWFWVHDARPGAIDTSFVPADNINNPRAVNAVFNLPGRLEIASKIGVETSKGGALDLPEVRSHMASEDAEEATFATPHILWDGADSVGPDAALTRVYINIGEYHQEWIRHISPILGARTQSPITVASAQENSVHWNATQERAGDLLAYLIRAGYPMYLAEAAGGAGAAHLQGERADEDYQPVLERGKVVFAESCARCHSSKLPEPIVGLEEAGCVGADYLDCWQRYWDWTETAEFKERMTEMVLADDFLDGNFLSTDARIPVTQLETEVCSAMASNGIEGHVWEDFVSQSYRDLPSVGELTLHDPVRGVDVQWQAPDGGRGYQRVPSLVSIWATAPLLHNNEVGLYTGDPSVAGRLASFDDSIRKFLWPETREGIVRATDRRTDIKVSTRALPGVVGAGARLFGLVDSSAQGDMITLGPVPEGTPVNLLVNLNLDRADPRVSTWGLLRLTSKIAGDLGQIRKKNLSDEEATELLRGLVPQLIEASACPDFIVDRGHPFGSDLPDADKEALIEYLKTL